MVSRRKILSRSKDGLNLETFHQDEEDVWYQKEKLFKVRMMVKINFGREIQKLQNKFNTRTGSVHEHSNILTFLTRFKLQLRVSVLCSLKSENESKEKLWSTMCFRLMKFVMYLRLPSFCNFIITSRHGIMTFPILFFDVRFNLFSRQLPGTHSRGARQVASNR